MTLTKAIAILLLCFVHTSLGLALQQDPVGIAGGHAVDIKDAPFMASLLLVNYNRKLTEEMLCGGSIVHERFILTAAHCIVFRMDLYPIVVRVGSSRLHKGEAYQVEKYISHDLFDKANATYDVGLLKLTKPVTFGPTVALMKLADFSFVITPGLTANASGWGMYNESIYEESQTLQQITLTVPSQDNCEPWLETDGWVVCMTKSNQTQGVCNGDSGGPLTVGDLQIGIASKGSACFNYVNEFVTVAPHLDWIQDNIKQNLE